MLWEKYVSYQLAWKRYSAQTLENRRVKLCGKFAQKNYNSENCMFSKVGSKVKTRQKSDLVKEYKCNSKRYQLSSLPYLAKLLNANNRKK